MTDELKDQVAIVTGGARGIGREVVFALVERGAMVVAFDINQENLDKLQADAAETPDQIDTAVVDVSDSEKVTQAIDAVAEKYGRIDILVNNAGITRDGLLISMDDQQFDQVININLRSAFLATRATARHMLRARRGKIVNMASVSGVMGNAGQANYSASKAGMIGLTKTTAKELGKRGITANAVAPGFITSEMTDILPEKVKQAVKPLIALQRFGTQKEVADVVTFLAGPQSNYITGQVFVVDGGLRM